MGIDFRGIQVLVSQHLLHRPHIHAVLQHQRGSGMPKLMRGVLGAVQPRLRQAFFHQGIHHRPADSLVSPRQKQGVPIRPGDGPAHRQIIRQRILTRLVQIHDPHLITLTQNPQCVVVDIRQVQPDQLRNTQPAVQKQCQNAQIPLPVWSIHRLQQGNALIQGQIPWQRFFQLGCIDILHGIVIQLVHFVA